MSDKEQRYNILLPIKVKVGELEDKKNWFSSNLNTFVLLDQKGNPEDVSRQVQRFCTSEAYRKSGNIDKRINFIQPQITNSNFNIVPDHKTAEYSKVVNVYARY